MLHLDRRQGESILIGHHIRVTVLDTFGVRKGKQLAMSVQVGNRAPIPYLCFQGKTIIIEGLIKVKVFHISGPHMKRVQLGIQAPGLLIMRTELLRPASPGAVVRHHPPTIGLHEMAP